MTIRQDTLAALKGETPMRVPWNIHHELLPRGNYERRLRNAGLGVIDKGHTAYVAVAENVSLETRTTWDGGARSAHITYHTPTGSLKGRKVIGPDGSPWVREYPVKDRRDLSVLEFMVRDTVYYPDPNRILAAQANLGDDGIVLCRMFRSPLQRLLIEWMGTEAVLYALEDFPAEMEHLLETMSDADQAAFEIVARSPAEVAWSAENITSSITSPRLFSRYCQPYYNRMAALLHSEDKLYGIHMDGLLRALAPAISETEIDFVEGFTPPPMGNLDLVQARLHWPDKALWTNFPASLFHCSEETVVGYVLDLLRTGMTTGRFLLTVTEDFPEPEKNLRLLCRAVREYEINAAGQGPAK